MMVAQDVRAATGQGRNWFAETGKRDWRAILASVGLRPERWIFNILKKIPPEHCREETVAALAKAFRNRHPRMRVLSHMPRITRDTIALLEWSSDVVSAKLLLSSSVSDYDEQPISGLVNSISGYLFCKKDNRTWPYGNLTAKNLANVEARLRWRFREEGGDLLDPFPPPPIPGIPGRIEPIRDLGALGAEADGQRNCACEYVGNILMGRSYLYAISVFERATLALRNRRDADVWVIEDLRGLENGDPSEETTNFVMEWLETHYRAVDR